MCNSTVKGRYAVFLDYPTQDIGALYIQVRARVSVSVQKEQSACVWRLLTTFLEVDGCGP